MNKRTFRLPVRRVAVEIGVALGLVLTVLLTAVLWHRERVSAAVCADTLRLHILANSDTVEDQLLKLKVRDAVLQEICPDILADADDKADAVAAVRTAQRRLRKTAEDTLRRAGSGQTVAVRLEQAEFDAKDYGSFRLPGRSLYPPCALNWERRKATTGSVCSIRNCASGAAAHSMRTMPRTLWCSADMKSALPCWTARRNRPRPCAASDEGQTERNDTCSICFWELPAAASPPG